MKGLFKRSIKEFIKRLGYILIPVNDPLFKSQHAFPEQKKLLGSKKDITIFDVGAHFGETATKYLNLFPHARIFSFEPFLDSYQILQKNVSSFEGIKTFNLALGNEIGEVNFNLNSDSLTNSILSTDQKGPSTWWVNALETINTIKVRSTTIDNFITENDINQIDILKIDTQGTEYFVIEGGKESFANGKIKIIYLEIILMPTYVGQKNLEEIIKILRCNGFNLYDIYNNNYTDKGQLRQVDAIFVHELFPIV